MKNKVDENAVSWILLKSKIHRINEDFRVNAPEHDNLGADKDVFS